MELPVLELYVLLRVLYIHDNTLNTTQRLFVFQYMCYHRYQIRLYFGGDFKYMSIKQSLFMVIRVNRQAGAMVKTV